MEYLKAGNASEAYRRAYPISVNWKESTLNSRASELMANSKVVGRLAELKAPAIKNAMITFESHLTELERLKTEAMAQGNVAAAIRAEELRAKAAGLYAGKEGSDKSVEIKIAQRIELVALT